MTLGASLPWIGGGLVLVLLLLLLKAPLQRLLRLILRTCAGLLALAVVNPFTALVGVNLGVNLMNALVLALLGVPGFGLLLMLHWSFLP